MRRLAGIVAVVLAVLVAPAGAATGVPPSLRCQGDLVGSPHPPVLLLHGTGVDSEVNWSWGYEKALLDRGEGVCWFDYPQHATVDMQETIPMTAAAIREVSRRAGGRRVATIGHSQGAAQAVLALRFFPDLAPLLDDVIGLSGAYDGGSAAIGADCADGGCSPPFWQFKPGSRLLRSLATRPVPAGPSLTAIGTLYDTVVTPQPAANQLPGGRSIEIQDICPGRRFVPGYDHIQMAGDAVAYALAIDALDHPGPADPARVSRTNCALELFPGADPVKLATLAPQLAAAFQGDGSAADVKREPALHCPFATGCDVLATWKRVGRLRPGAPTVLRVDVRRAGRVRLRVAGRAGRPVAVQPGRLILRLEAPPRHGELRLEAQSLPGTRWATVGVLRRAPRRTPPAPRLDPGPPRYAGMVKESDLPIVMRDGVKLFADAYRPALADGSPAPGRFPVVVTITPYNKSAGVAAADPLFVTHGYVHVIVDARGTGSSEGTWESWGEAERLDYPAVVEWAAHQPWADGRTVMYGNSYMAFTQIMAAAQHPPSLRAIFPIVPADDTYRDITWTGGNLKDGFVPLWLGLVSALRMIPPGYTFSDPAEAAQVLAEHGILGARFPAMTPTDALLGGDNGYDGPFYQERSPGHYAGRVDVPTFVTAGWYDIFQRGAPRLYERLRLPDTRKKLLVGPWYHVTAGNGLGQAGTPPDLDVLALAWFEHWVRGVHNGIERFPNVTHYELGADRWTTDTAWPPRDVQWQRWYLRGEHSGSAHSLNDGTLAPQPPDKPGADSGILDTPNGGCTRSIVQWSAGLARVPGCETDDRSQEPTSLTYTTPVLTAPLHVAGPIGLTLRGSSTTRDATWTATLTDVAPDGTATQITAGWLRTAMRALDARRTQRSPAGDVVVPYHPFTKASERPVQPGRTVTLQIEIFNTDVVLRPGHRLRLTISGGDIPNAVPTVPTAANSAGQVQTVHRDPAAPSYLTLPTVPGPA